MIRELFFPDAWFMRSFRTKTSVKEDISKLYSIYPQFGCQTLFLINAIVDALKS